MVNGGKWVLIIEDEDDMQRLLAAMLKAEDVEIIPVGQAKEAVPVLQRHAGIDLIILDIMLPDMDGLGFLEQIRRQPKYDTIPVLVVSALEDSREVRRARRLGADDYISKKKLSELFVPTVRRILREGRKEANG